MDSIDGSFMNFAYGWALSQPVRKVFYNLTITGLSVGGGRRHRHDRARGAAGLTAGPVGRVLGVVGGDRPQHVGFVIVGLFVATWALALAVWRYGRIEERWGAALHEQRP